MTYVCSLSEGRKASGEGEIVLKTIEELYRIIPRKETREIIFEGDFIEEYFTPSGFTSFIKECKRVNKFLDVIYDNKYTFCFNEVEKSLKDIKDPESLIKYILSHKEESLKVIQRLCRQYESDYRDTLNEGSRLGNMHLELIEARCLKEQEIKEHNITRNKLAEVTAKLDAMISSANYKSGRVVDIERCSGIKASTRSYKKILYVKEITRVHFVDTLLYYLQEIIRSMNAEQARFMVIEPAYSDNRIALYPRCKPYVELTNKDVSEQDIFIAGFRADIVESVLKNPSNAEYLIVLDRSGYENVLVNGNDIEILYTVSDLEDVKFNAALDHLISYNSRTLYIPYIKNFNELAPEDRINSYYSMDITKTILALLEGKD